jgi:lipopolysaccharide/colanic/teichoic acid biosynthesis glycosyltransferase
MTRNHIKSSGVQAGPAAWQRSLWTAAAWLAALLLGAGIWLVSAETARGGWRPVWGYCAALLLTALLAYALFQGLRDAPLDWKWRCRLAFLLGAGVTWFFLFFHWAKVASPRLSFIQLCALLFLAWLGSWLGGLWATATEMGLWENNSPPPLHIEAEVQRLHRQRIGQGDPVPWAKRAFDLLLAVLGLLLSTPVWALSLFLVWIEDPGPLLFVKNSVARGGANFRQLKLRTMVHGAEEHTGPVLAYEADQRVLRSGRLLRKTALDELPQLINILRGEMSFVGPRPQRTVLVHEYLQRMPEYAERHRVLPGLAGLAQVAGDYYLTPRQKLRFDRLYIRYTGLGYDLLLLYLAFLIAFWYRWKSDWNGRLPRRLLHGGKARR